jgi:hypothetical protein
MKYDWHKAASFNIEILRGFAAWNFANIVNILMLNEASTHEFT